VVTFHFLQDAGNGWSPVTHMVALAVKLFDGLFEGVLTLRRPFISRARLHALRLPRGGPKVGVFIARNPKEIVALGCLPAIREAHKSRILWIIDSFQIDWLPHRRVLDQFDIVIFTQAYDAGFYEELVGDRALWLGWGSDVLDLGSYEADRGIDILRVGRQPDEWDDDGITQAACLARGLSFQGRPPRAASQEASQIDLMRNFFARAKFCIAHSNVAAPASYTHPTKEYITARWTDALASGASVAGIPPWTDVDLINWPGALLAFDRIDLESNLEELEAAVQRWTPQTALNNHLEALRRLDWRWRFLTLAERSGLTPNLLLEDVNRLKKRINQLQSLFPTH
jgi:hypothetical protein